MLPIKPIEKAKKCPSPPTTRKAQKGKGFYIYFFNKINISLFSIFESSYFKQKKT
jgi:hypothetical protein